MILLNIMLKLLKYIVGVYKLKCQGIENLYLIIIKIFLHHTSYLKYNNAIQVTIMMLLK